jgi:hypothetical protein
VEPHLRHGHEGSGRGPESVPIGVAATSRGAASAPRKTITTSACVSAMETGKVDSEISAVM